MSSPTLAAEPDGRAGAEIAVRAGAAAPPFEEATLSPAQAHGGVILMTAWAALIRDALWLSVRAPLVLASVQQPASSYVDDVVLGNVEATAHFRATIWRHDTLRADVRASLGIGLPTAPDDPLRIDRRALAFGDALLGGRAPELFAARSIPLLASTSVSLATDRWSTRLGATLAAGEHAVPIFEAEGGAWIVGPVGVATGVRVFFLREPDVVTSFDASVLVRAGAHMTFALEASVPLGWAGAGVGPSMRLQF